MPRAFWLPWGRPALTLRVGFFLGLSLLDLSLTGFLVQGGGGWFYEGNPVARFWLATFGWVGLAAFKAGLATLVVGVALLVARRSPRAGRRLLSLACLVLTLVLTYSCLLAMAGAQVGPESQNRLDKAKLRTARLQKEYVNGLEFQSMKQELARDLIAGRLHFPEAVRRLRETSQARDENWFILLRRAYPGCTDEECLASLLLAHTLTTLEKDSDQAGRVADRLREEFRADYNPPPPRSRHLALHSPLRPLPSPAAASVRIGGRSVRFRPRAAGAGPGEKSGGAANRPEVNHCGGAVNNGHRSRLAQRHGPCNSHGPSPGTMRVPAGYRNPGVAGRS